VKAKAVPLIHVKGSPSQRGREQGEGAREQVVRMADRYRAILQSATGLPWDRCLDASRSLLGYAEAAFPHLVDELRGIAEGAGVPFEDLWLLNCYEGVREMAGTRGGCTCLAVRGEHTTSGHVLMAHNEDWISLDRENVYLVHAEPDDGVPFLGMTYGGLLVNIGLNAAGIGVAINSVYPTDGQPGVPRIVYSRAILDARTIGEAIGACLARDRDGGYNYLVADSHGELYNVETSARQHRLLYGDRGWLVHTNHYLSPAMQAIERPGRYIGSHVRYHRARRLLQGHLGTVSAGSLQMLLRDHVNRPDSICGHEDGTDEPHERSQTIISLVMDLTERSLWAAPGPPCETAYSSYGL
jgi:isopenicillin-N N-acyltransferase-like protein